MKRFREDEFMTYTLTWRVPHDDVDMAEGLLADIAPWGWEETAERLATTLRLHVQNRKQVKQLKEAIVRDWPDADLHTDKEKDTEWQTAWQAFFQPVEVAGTFRIIPPWLAKDPDPDASFIPLVIHPKMAFGTGHHATTKLCLQAMAKCRDQGRWPEGGTILDLGTGSGILSIAAAQLGASCVGVDVDPVAMDNAWENVQANQVHRQVKLICGDVHALRPGQTFPLVVANILAGPLIHMAPDLAARVAPGGGLILSGVLISQAESVGQAYTLQGMGTPQTVHLGEWAALIWPGGGTGA